MAVHPTVVTKMVILLKQIGIQAQVSVNGEGKKKERERETVLHATYT